MCRSRASLSGTPNDPNDETDFEAQNEYDPGLPPALFLHILREHGGISLTVEEEATLLDCLDTERLAQIHGVGAEEKPAAFGTKPKAMATIGNSYTIPQIYYRSFLSFLSRHCGHWHGKLH